MKISNPQFLIISAQSFGEESQQTVAHRKIARSHAARASHARVRRLRTIQYQARTRSVKSSVPARDEHQYSQTHQKFPVISLLSASRQDPFTCFATPLKPIEEMLFDHYVNIVIPLMSCQSPNVKFCELVKRAWIPAARADARLLDIIFLLSCRHLHKSHAESDQEIIFMQKGLFYKSKCLKTLRGAICNEAPRFTDSTIAQAIMLAYDELFVRDMRMLKHHTEGALQMVRLKGGPETLGFNGLLKDLLSKLVSKGSSEFELHDRFTRGWTLVNPAW